MIRPTRAWRAAAILAAATLVLSACGSDDPESSDEPSGSDTSEGAPEGKGDGTLTIGSLLPQTGDLAFLGPPEFAGVELAVEDINKAGGVLGQDVVNVKADSGDGTPDIAGAETDKLLSGDSDVIVGAAASGVSVTVIDKITSAGVVQFSPANTAAGFDTAEYDKLGMYFRTAPSDVLQGEILANLIVEDGFENVAVMGRQDVYGEGLSERVKEVLEEKGATVPAFEIYSADAQNFTAEVNTIAAAKPDALVLVTFEEFTKIVPQLIAKGIGPQDIQLYMVDGNLADYSEESFDLTGVKGTYPAAASPDEDFLKRLRAEPSVKSEVVYGPESYDATIISALAAIAADSDAGTAIAEEIPGVTRDGTKCTSFEECAQMLEDGEDIDYDGASGPTDMTDSGSLSTGSYDINEYKGNTYHKIDNVSGVVPTTQ
jgi:ABC-type branched-subunit amino acid transport system substrate-binding protein